MQRWRSGALKRNSSNGLEQPITKPPVSIFVQCGFEGISRQIPSGTVVDASLADGSKGQIRKMR
jgi:hypothetical protein